MLIIWKIVSSFCSYNYHHFTVIVLKMGLMLRTLQLARRIGVIHNIFVYNCCSSCLVQIYFIFQFFLLLFQRRVMIVNCLYLLKPASKRFACVARSHYKEQSILIIFTPGIENPYSGLRARVDSGKFPVRKRRHL